MLQVFLPCAILYEGVIHVYKHQHAQDIVHWENVHGSGIGQDMLRGFLPCTIVHNGIIHVYKNQHAQDIVHHAHAHGNSIGQDEELKKPFS